MHLPRSITSARTAVLALAAFALAACDDTPGEPTTPATITAVSGATVNGRVGSTANVTISVTNTNGRTLANQPVTFAVATGGGSVVPPSSSTDANGQATAVWTFGNTLGAQTLTVTSGGISQTISATVTAGLPASVSVSAGANQTAAVGAAVATAPAVLVRDAANNPVAGVTVQFATLSGGTVAPTSVTTDASGIARVTSWTLGPQTGTQTLQATVLGQTASNIAPAQITATATAGAAARVSQSGTLPATATVGSALTTAQLPTVIVTDAGGNPVSGATVTFAVTGGGGSLTGAVASTNAQGVASPGGFTLGQTAGANTVTATVANVGVVSFSIAGTAAAAAQTQLVSGDNQSVRAGQALAAGPSVRVVDRFGNPVPGATVQFVVTSGGGSVLGGTQTTNAQGVATVGGWTLGTTPGTNTLVARVAGAADVTFTATGQAGAPAQLIRVSGDSQTVVSFRAAGQPFAVRVLDAGGFPVVNTTVAFAVDTAASGTVSPASATTDANGVARSTFTSTSVLGEAIISATVPSAPTLPAVTFVVTTTANQVAQVVAASATSQQATVGAPVQSVPAVQFRDALGNPVAGVTVFWGIDATQGGSRGASTSVSDANGVATVGSWTLGLNPGTYTLLAISSVPSNIPGATLTFTATAVAVPAGAVLTVEPGVTPATAPAGTNVSVAVRVKDAAGNAVSGVSVQFQVTAGGGSIAGSVTKPAITDANGIARIDNWTLGSAGSTLNAISALLLGTGQIQQVTVTTQ